MQIQGYISNALKGLAVMGKIKGGGDWGEREETGREAREREKGDREKERGKQNL